jgi:hypothetical protein
VLLYEAATGDRPLPGAPHPLPDLRADVDPAFAALVARMLQSDPAARPHDGGSVLAGLTSTATIGTTRASTRTVAIDRSGTAGDAHPDQAATHRLHLAEPRRLEPTATMPVTTPSTPAPPRPVREPVARSRRPWRVVAPVVVALAVGAVGVGILLTTGNRDPGTGATPTITEPAPAAPTGATSVSAAPSTLPSPVERDLRRLERAVQP